MTAPTIPPAAHAEVIREYVPFADCAYLHGVTFDGKLVWFARDDELVAFDPEAGNVVRRLAVPSADAGTAFDGTYLYQLAKSEIVVVDPHDGRVVRRLRAPADGAPSGMSWADGCLYVGQFREMRIHKIDARTGAVLGTLTSDRWVVGVSWVDGALWHAASFDGKSSELRRVTEDGTVAERLHVAVEAISGIEGIGGGAFWCAGEKGKLRLVRRATGR